MNRSGPFGLFATRDNHKLPTFMSLFPDGMAWAVDVMSLSRKGMWAYPFSPFPLVPKVLAKIRAELVEIVLVALTGVEHGAPTLGKTANAAQVECIPSKSAGAPASCMETIAPGVRSAGFSKDVAERVARGKLG